MPLGGMGFLAGDQVTRDEIEKIRNLAPSMANCSLIQELLAALAERDAEIERLHDFRDAVRGVGK